MKKFETLQECVAQLEKCNYQTPDGLHELKMNTAFIQLKEFSKENNICINQLKQSKDLFCFQCEIETKVSLNKSNEQYCSNCGLKH